MVAVYSAFGLRLSSNLPLPGLMASPAPSAADVEVWLDCVPSWLRELRAGPRRTWYTSAHKAECGRPALVVERLQGGGHDRFLYGDGTEFIVERSGRQVFARWPSPLTLEDAATYLLGPVLGFVLRLRGVVCLHASALAFADRAFVLLGPAGAGKSTTAAAFTQLGLRVLSDDVAALEDGAGGLAVHPGNPRLRLWPDSVRTLFGAADALPRLTPNWDKRYLDLTGGAYHSAGRPLPLAAVYVLGERRDEAPCVEAITARDGLLALVANTYTNYLLDETMRAREFTVLGRLVAGVPARRASAHTSAARLPELCRLILDDFRRPAGRPLERRGAAG
jgi:hypothetical protein